jgi:hypothetical protein
MSKQMFAKYAGRCYKCHQTIPVNSLIEWTKGVGAAHLPNCPLPVAPAVSAPRPRPLPTAPVVPVTIPNLRVEASGIVALLNTAKAHLKYPKVRFAAPQGGELRLVTTGPTSKYPNAVNIYVDFKWQGRINADGTVTQNAAHLVPVLQSIALDPAKAAKEFGALTGRCSFCNIALTDEGSVEVGYGPVCAKHYGLPHKAKGTKTVSVPSLVPAPTVTPDPIPSTDVVVGHRVIRTIKDSLASAV